VCVSEGVCECVCVLPKLNDEFIFLETFPEDVITSKRLAV
jgi:hypothetical protein